MKILEIKNTGSIAFPQGITWTPGEAEKVAVIGGNGSGKTTLLDSICMAFYGVTPNRRSESGREEGAIYGCFKDKASYVEVKAEIGGKLIHVKRLIDPIAKTQKPYLYVDGKAVTEGKIKEFGEKFLEYTDLSEDLFLSALYHSQRGKGHLVSLDQAGARDLLGNLLGFEEYDEEFELVDSQRKSLEQALSADEVLAKNLQATISEEEFTKESLQALVKESIQIDKDLEEADKKIQEANQRLADFKSETLGLRELQDKKSSLESGISTTESEVKDLLERLKNNLALKEKESEIKKAVEDKKGIEEQISFLEKSITDGQSALEAKTKEIEESNKKVNQEISELEDQKSKLRKDLDVKTSDLSEQRNKITKLNAMLQEAQKKSSLLTRVPCNGVEISGKKLSEACELLADAVSAQSQIKELSSQIEKLTLVCSEAEKEVESIKTQLREIDEKKLAQSKLLQSFDVLTDSRNSLESRRKDVQSQKLALLKFNDLEKQLANLALVDERVKDYQTKISFGEGFLKQLKADLESVLKSISDKQSEADALNEIEEDIRIKSEWKKNLSTNRDKLISERSKLEAKLQQISEAKTKLDSLGTKAKQDRLRILKNLTEALSPKGVRALKLDAAGPEISHTINEILNECYGSRFQVSIKTTKETGKGTTKEDFSIMVLDEETGEETFVDNKSGGEEAIIKEGISLGVAVFKKQKTGADMKTLIRDEADGGLTSKNAHLYQKMLSKAMMLGGFAQVIFVSHKPEIQELADAIFKVENGSIRLLNEVAL